MAKKALKSHWDYRILAHDHNGHIGLQMHEVHYKEDKPNSYSVDAAYIYGDTLIEIGLMIARMMGAGVKPILWAGERFPQEYSPSNENYERI